MRKKMNLRRRRPSETQFNTDLDRELIDALERYCEEAKVTRKATITLALRRFLNMGGFDIGPRV